MKTITVDASSRYDIHIGSGIRHLVGKYACAMKGVQKVCVVSDTNVFPLYGNEVCQALEASGLEVCSFVFPSGEAH